MPENLAYRFYRLIWETLDWIYPPVCAGCGQPGASWCKSCIQNTNRIEPPTCDICGNTTLNAGLCERCQVSRPLFTSLRSYAVFSGSIRNAIHQLKYRRNIGLGEVLSRPMISSLRKLNWKLDVVTSVPLGLVRMRERGYNQATLLARPIALCLKVPFMERALVRSRETRSQVGLTVVERHENMAGAFHPNRKVITGKIVLVVDDVATSGATLNACAKALLDGGATEVYGFSLARALFNPKTELDRA